MNKIFFYFYVETSHVNNARWLHIYQLKVSAVYSFQKYIMCTKHVSLNLGKVLAW